MLHVCYLHVGQVCYFNRFSVKVWYSNHIALRIHALPLMILQAGQLLNLHALRGFHPSRIMERKDSQFVHRLIPTIQTSDLDTTSPPLNISVQHTIPKLRRHRHLPISSAPHVEITRTHPTHLFRPDKRSFASVKVLDNPLIELAAVSCAWSSDLLLRVKGKVWCRAEGFLWEVGERDFLDGAVAVAFLCWEDAAGVLLW